MEKKVKTRVCMEESSSYGIRASVAGFLLVGGLAASVIYTAYAGPLFDGLLGRNTESKTVEVQVDDRAGEALLGVLQVYAKENPEASVLTAGASGEVTETDPADLAGVVTDSAGNAIGVLVEDRGVEDADGNHIGAVLPDGTFVDGAAGVTGDGIAYYHVVWGDTLCKVSSAVHYSVQELAEYNHIFNVNLIYAESDLRIPLTENISDGEEE